MTSPRGKAGVFLDRDGTLVDEPGFLVDPDRTRLLPGAAAAVAALNRADLTVVLVTNQSAIARGLLDEPVLAAVHARMNELLAVEGARIDLILHCPHHPDFGPACDCRKPGAGMLTEAASRLGLDLSACWMVGDAARDLEAGRRAGLRDLVLVATGKGTDEHARLTAEGVNDYAFADDLQAAVAGILEHGARSS